MDIKDYLNKGYRIVYKDKSYITFISPKPRFKKRYLLLWTIFTGGIGLFGYITYHYLREGKIITIEFINGGKKWENKNLKVFLD